MTKRSILFLLMALAVAGWVMTLSGCSEEKAKEPATEEAAPPAAVQTPQEPPAAQETPAEEAQAEPTQPGEAAEEVLEEEEAAPPMEAVEEPEEEAAPEEAVEEPVEETVPAAEPAAGAEEEPSAEPAGKSSEAQDAPAEVTIMASLWEERTKGPVQFTHQKHAVDHGIGCADCHHVFEDGKNVYKAGMPVQKCQECHNEPTQQGESKLTDALKIRNLKMAYHKNCQGCHRKVKKDTPDKNPPPTCKGCHQPKEG